MGRMEKVLTAMTATAVIAFSSLTGWTLWTLGHLPASNGWERVSDGLRWRGRAYTAELTLLNGVLEQLVVWRNGE